MQTSCSSLPLGKSQHTQVWSGSAYENNPQGIHLPVQVMFLLGTGCNSDPVVRFQSPQTFGADTVFVKEGSSLGHVP